MTREICKTLSANDLGTTGAHQAGILVPKDPEILAFFPVLDRSIKNPRQVLVMREYQATVKWEFHYIYYNNRRFGGTRNEFRLTHMTKYFRALNAAVGDDLSFSMDADHSYVLALRRASSAAPPTQGTLILSGGWKVIKI